MKLNIWTILIISSLHFSAYSQLFLGAKSGYNRYFDPGMNGGNIAFFTELPFGEYYGASVRAGLFYDFPMKIEEMATLYPINNGYLPDGYVPVTSWYKNIGINIEYIHYFYNDAFETGLYSVIKNGISYSSITRKTNGFDVSDHYQTDHVENNKKFSLYFGVGLGFQFALGPNSLLFTEIHGGFPFFSIRRNDAASSMVSGYPPVTVSGIVGFKRSVFN